jgi:hypothetical protein
VTQTEPQTSFWKHGAHTADGTVKAIGESPPDLVRWLMRKGNALKLAVGLGKSHRAFGGTVAQVPDDPATDDGGQIDALSETLAMLFIGQDIDRQRQATHDQSRDEAVLSQGTNQAIEGHGRDMADGRTPLQTEATVGGHQGLPRHIGTHATITQHKMRQDREDRLAARALHAPDGEAAKPEPSVVGMAAEAAIIVTGRFMGELKTQGKDEGEDSLDKRLAIADQLEVGGWVLEIDGDGTVLAGRFGGLCHVSSPCRRWWGTRSGCKNRTHAADCAF